MFFRLKKSGHRSYVQIVENKREGAAVRQTVIANLGRADELAASGALAALIASGARLTDQVLLIDSLGEDAEGALSVAAKRIGGPLLFGRIWERLGIDAVLAELLRERAFEFPVERAVFVATLHRLFVSGSDRDCASWMEDYDIRGAEGLGLHHFYRAMAWLGEEVEEKPAGALAPRCVKDLIEEKLFERRRDLFTDLSAVFMDTTSLSFYGEGGETLGEHGYSKDYRPDLNQMILGLVVDGEGTPIPGGRPGEVAGQYRRRDDAAARHRPPATALFDRPGLRRRRSRHDLGPDHRRAREAQAGIHPGRARALRRRRAQDRARQRRSFRPAPRRAQGGRDAALRQAGEGRRQTLCRLP